MEFDLVHAAIAAILIFLTVLGVYRIQGPDRERGKWNWTVFFAVFVVMAILNIVWSYVS